MQNTLQPRRVRTRQGPLFPQHSAQPRGNHGQPQEIRLLHQAKKNYGVDTSNLPTNPTPLPSLLFIRLPGSKMEVQARHTHSWAKRTEPLLGGSTEVATSATEWLEYKKRNVDFLFLVVKNYQNCVTDPFRAMFQRVLQPPVLRRLRGAQECAPHPHILGHSPGFSV